jgi:hypothetical protein
MRLLVVGVFGVLVGLVAGAAVGIHAQERPWTSDDTLAALEQYAVEFDVSYAWLRSIVRCETGGTYSPYAVGRQGELGAVQLHPRGRLSHFLSIGYDDPFDPYQSIRYLAQEISFGRASAWSCARWSH